MIRTRSPLSPGQALVLARLACIRRAASVRPEPGSNSPSRPRVPPGINRGFPRSESCRRRSLNLRRQLSAAPNNVRSSRHGIDMWSPCIRSRSDNGSRTGFRLSLLCFQEAAPRPPHEAACRSDTRVHFRWLTRSSRRRPDPWARALESGEKTLVSTGPVVPGPSNGRDPACGARGETTDSARPMQTHVTKLRRPWSGPCPLTRRRCRLRRSAAAPIAASRSAPRARRVRPGCTPCLRSPRPHRS